jgi:hypothetical protein
VCGPYDLANRCVPLRNDEDGKIVTHPVVNRRCGKLSGPEESRAEEPNFGIPAQGKTRESDVDAQPGLNPTTNLRRIAGAKVDIPGAVHAAQLACCHRFQIGRRVAGCAETPYQARQQHE